MSSIDENAAQIEFPIQVHTKENVFVVDSRLIAQRLEIEHDTFMETLETYQSQIEQAFGIIRVETEKTGKKGRPKRFAFLNEDQSYLAMTFSRNTPAVVQCKIDLVKAFSIARNRLEEKTAQIWKRHRIEGKSTRRTFTDAVQDYIDRHRSELSENSIKWMYINASEQVNLIVFGRKAKRLADDLQIPRDVLRDGMTSEELQLVREVENTAMRMIDRLDMHPLEAVKLAGVNLLIPQQNRTLAQLGCESA